jgi:hypothetical protein
MLATPQEIKHAPTLQSCVADLSLWTSQEESKSLAALEMLQRIRSMMDCTGAYPALTKSKPDGDLPAAWRLKITYEEEMQDRLFHFVDRHGLTRKFEEEDEAGKR